MSIKVYRGFKFTDDSIHTVFSRLQEFRKRVHELAIDAEGEYLANRIVRSIDSDACNGREPSNYISAAIKEMREEQQKSAASGGRHPLTDFEFRVMLLPYNGELYGMVFTEHQEWYNEFLSSDWVADYWYASVERPVNVTQDEWETRESTWRGIMEPTFVPSQCGFEMDLSLEVYRWPESGNILKHVKSFGDRVKDMVEDRLLVEKSKQLRELDPAAAEENIFDVYFKAKKWIETSEGDARRREVVKEIEPLLQHVIDIDTMRGVRDNIDAAIGAVTMEASENKE